MEAHPPSWQSRADSCAFWLLLLTTAWSPWPLGSNRSWAVGVLALSIWAGVLLASLAAAFARRPTPAPRFSKWRFLPMASLGGFAALLAAQLMPRLGEAGGPISIDPFQTRVYLLTTLIYLGAWLLVLQTVGTRHRAAQLLGALVLAGVVQAFAAVLLYATGGHYDFLFTQFDQGGRATGTFPNPDHLAGYMELCLSAGLGWLLAQLGSTEQAAGRGWRGKTVRLLAFLMSTKMLLRLLLVIMVIALVMTHSRMGNGAFFISLAITGAIVATCSRQLRRPALWLVASMAVVDIFIVGQWVGLDQVVQRLSNTAEGAGAPTASGFGAADATTFKEETVAQRLVIPRLSINLFETRPWFGHGGGSYPTAFPPFKTAAVPGQMLYWDHAHNDYVQVAADTGSVGLFLWLLPALTTAWRATRLLRDGQSKENRAFGIAALMAICTIGMHGMVDFNLHIPANALTFSVILAACWALPESGARRRRSAKRHVESAPSEVLNGER